jgi:hypothetical protein
MFFDMMGEKKTTSLLFKKRKEYPTGGGYFFRDSKSDTPFVTTSNLGEGED